ncbi:cold-shock protein [Marinomonas posidonica]|uniref:cold-shock protein n=1 Tax=Marinomonas posidonica TaxID=936476 RepID=UPI0037360365
MQRLTGSVKWFNDAKGIGFIKREADADVFVHYKSISCTGHKTLKKGQSVSFVLTKTDFGLQAMDVQVENSVTQPVQKDINEQAVGH